MIGEMITNPSRIVELASEKKCVYVKRNFNVGGWLYKILPAAFVQNWQFRYLMNLIKNNQVFEYKKEKK